MTSLVLEAGAAGTGLVPPYLHSGESTGDRRGPLLEPSLALSQQILDSSQLRRPVVQLALPGVESICSILRCRLEIEHTFGRFVNDGGEFVANQAGDGLPHRHTEGFAVAAPGRPDRV